MVEVALILIIKLLFFGIVVVTIINMALLIAIAIILHRQ